MTQLFEIEQAIAARCGPFLLDTAAAGTTSEVTLTSQQSTLALGDQWTAQYLLRRGLVNNGGSPLPNFLTSDRVRRIAAPINRATGKISVDRPWTVAPIGGETIEFHYLDPSNELTPCALAGLRRCFVLDRASVATTGVAAERDMTALAPWITDLGQIYEIGYVYPGSFYIERPVPWWREFLQNGHVTVQAMPDPFPNNLLITARRSVDTLVTKANLPPPTLHSTNVVWPIVGVLNTTPVTLQLYQGHPFQTDDWINLNPGLGDPLDGTTWQVTVLDAATITLNGSTGSINTPMPAPDSLVWLAFAQLKLENDPASVPMVVAQTGPFAEGDQIAGITQDPGTGAAQLRCQFAAWPFTVGEMIQVTMDPGSPPGVTGQWTILSIVGNAMTFGQGGYPVLGNAPFATGYVQLMRPALTGRTLAVTDDLNDYLVSLDYATAWGVVSLWDRFPHRLAPGAAAGRIMTREQANIEASLQALKNFKAPARRNQLSTPFNSWQTSRL